LYNTLTPPPWDLPGNATQSGVMSRSINGGKQNFNAIRFEDKAGAEEVLIQAEREMNWLTKLNESHVVGVDFSVAVGAAFNVEVGGEVNCNVLGMASYAVGLAHSLLVGGAQTTAVAGASTLTVGEARSVTVGGASLHT
ncbi:bacteriophage T4 gp5 trimerisation domain-containing protein, partial [Burkholderia glumae]